jgi:galactokinase
MGIRASVSRDGASVSEECPDDTAKGHQRTVEGERATSFFPARVCLAGENVDWMLGPVVCATFCELGTRVVAKRSTKDTLVVRVLNAAGEVLLLESVWPQKRAFSPISSPLEYVRAALEVLSSDGFDIPALQLSITTSVPNSGGLATSAALLSSVIDAASRLLGKALSREAVAHSCYRAEREILGIKCGTMDPYAIAREGMQFLDCSQAPPEVCPLVLHPELRVVVGCSNHRAPYTDLAEHLCERWRANERRILRYAARAAWLATALRALCRSQYEASALGDCINECHRLITDELGIKNPELESLVAEARGAGALGAKSCGARPTGGSVVALVETHRVPAVVRALERGGATVLAPVVRGAISATPSTLQADGSSQRMDGSLHHWI